MSAAARPILPPDAPERRALAEQFVNAALRKVEAAQVLLQQAAEDLCPLRGLAVQWNACGGLYDRVKAFWYRLDEKRQRGNFQLDRPVEEFRFKPSGDPVGDAASQLLRSLRHLLADCPTGSTGHRQEAEAAITKAEEAGVRP